MTPSKTLENSDRIPRFSREYAVRIGRDAGSVQGDCFVEGSGERMWAMTEETKRLVAFARREFGFTAGVAMAFNLAPQQSIREAYRLFEQPPQQYPLYNDALELAADMSGAADALPPIPSAEPVG